MPHPKAPTGITGLDELTLGGFPVGRSTLVAGTSGSGKTVLALQALASAARDLGERGVLVTLEESADELIRNVSSFDWAIQEAIDSGDILILDYSMTPTTDVLEAGDFDFRGLLTRITAAVRQIDARRVVFDSVGSLFPSFADPHAVRRELSRLMSGMRELGVTTLVTAERVDEFGPVSRHGVEDFVADSVVILRHPLDQETRRRTLEVLKVRGAQHRKGERPFTIDPLRGIELIPHSAIEDAHVASTERIAIGNGGGIDSALGEGILRDSSILVSGSTGTGKTTLAIDYVSAGLTAGESCLYFCFEESSSQLLRNARSVGHDLDGAVQDGKLRVVAQYPDRSSLEDLLLDMRREVAEFAPRRVVVDSLSALERFTSPQQFHEFVVGLLSYLKAGDISGLFTTTSPGAGGSFAGHQMSTVVDVLLLLRYVESDGVVRRGLHVLKSRGGDHAHDIREITVSKHGLQLGPTIREVTGILSGIIMPMPVPTEQLAPAIAGTVIEERPASTGADEARA